MLETLCDQIYFHYWLVSVTEAKVNLIKFNNTECYWWDPPSYSNTQKIQNWNISSYFAQLKTTSDQVIEVATVDQEEDKEDKGG